MRIFVTGGNGTIGTALREFLPDAVYLSRHELDVADDARFDIAMRTAVANFGPPTALIHAAALTDHATPDARALIDVNVRGTERVARWCRAHGVRLAYLSTHYVYPGDRGHYRESDSLRPIGAYAMSKLAGEGWASIVPDALIVRGSWYTYETRLKAWIAQGAFHDAWISRESATSAAAKIAALTLGGATGTFNIGGPRRTFAQILRDEGYPEFVERTREGVRFASYAFPADVSVDTSKFDAWMAAHPKQVSADPAQLELDFATTVVAH